MLFVDMDGVLADFSLHVKNHLGIWPWDDDVLMQQEIPKIKDFWLTIPPLPDMNELWDGVKHLNPFVLTARASWDHDACVAAKPKWIAKHLPDFPQERLLIVRRSEKAKFAACPSSRRPRILIDDYLQNTTEWSRAGGRPILHLSARSTLIDLNRPEIMNLVAA